MLRDATHWTRLTIESGMTMGEADLFAVLMAKTVEYYTKAFPRVTHHGDPLTLGEALSQVREVGLQAFKSGISEFGAVPKAFARKAEQLSLFVRDAGAKYGKARN